MITRLAKASTLVDATSGSTQSGYYQQTAPTPGYVPGDVINAARISAGIVQGIEMDGGAGFIDTLGSFYPVTINNPQQSLYGLTINGSVANPNGLNFHNTTYQVDDVYLFPSHFTTGTTPTDALGLVMGHSSTMSRWALAMYDANENGDTQGFFFWPSATIWHNTPSLIVYERLFNETVPTGRYRFDAGCFIGGLDNRNDGTGALPLMIFNKAGAVSDADYTNAGWGSVYDGTIALDTTNSRFYVRTGGVWKYAALT